MTFVEPTSCSVEPPLAGAEDGKPSLLTPLGASLKPARATVPTPIVSDSRLATLRKASVQ
jgi:hypothetical protein